MSKFKLVRSGEPLEARNLFVVLFGQPGIGKTSLSFTMPGPVLHLDFDNGIERALQELRPDFFNITGYGDFHNFLFSREFEKFVADGGYKSIVLDTIGTLLDDYIAPWLVLNDPRAGNNAGGLTLQGWGALSVTFNRIKVRLQQLGLHVCAICHEKEEGDGNARQIRLAVKGGSTDIIYRSADMIGYMSVKGQDRHIDFRPTQVHVGKNTAGLEPGPVPPAESEEYISFLSANVVGKCIEKMTALSKKGEVMASLVKEYKESLGECEKEADFDAFIDGLKEEENKTVKAQIKRLLGKRMKELEMKFDKDLGKVVKIEEVVNE